jgi:pimeloyl-ACP methyl ester carboxylesterase
MRALSIAAIVAGLGIAAALAVRDASTAGTPAPQGPPAATPAAPVTPPPDRFTVQADGHPLAVWARRPATARAALLLVHGRTWSSRPDFDLQVPGLSRSVMAALAARGIAAYAVDLRGYGETPRDATGWLTPRRAAADIAAVLTWIAQQHPGLPPPALVGWSRGAAVSLLAAQMTPSKLSALVLFGFAYDPSLQFADGTVPDTPQMAKNTLESAASDFIAPDVTPRAVVQAFQTQALQADPIMMDLKGDAEFNALKPVRITTPTLLLYGEHDPNVSDEDAGRLFAKLGTHDKRIVELPRADHAAQIEDTHDAWVAAVAEFVGRPTTVRRSDR